MIDHFLHAIKATCAVKSHQNFMRLIGTVNKSFHAVVAAFVKFLNDFRCAEISSNMPHEIVAIFVPFLGKENV
jgi:hypothetical protein